MSLTDWATTLSGFTAVLIAVAALVRWMVKSYLIELKPNGGGSIKDAVNDIKREMVEIRVSLARLEGKFHQHVEETKD
jgi:hypothetical protein